MIQPALTIITFLSLPSIALAQLITPLEKRPDLPVPVELASQVPAGLAGNATLRFKDFSDLDMVFDGGSYGVAFTRDNGRQFKLFFPHQGYWTEAAIKNSTQPVAVAVRRGQKQVMVEIVHKSPLERRLVELLTTELETGSHAPKQKAQLTRIRDRLRDRKPLREIKEQADRKASEANRDIDPFGEK